MRLRLNEELDAHRAKLAACRRCDCGSGIAPIISLARSPRVMLVGQAPGKVEAAGGAPFSGRAGRTLFSWFARVGLSEQTIRSRVYIAAVTRCFPGSAASGRGDRVPSPEERERCAPWLESELRLIRPRLIIPVGRLAIDALLGPGSLATLIGRAHRPADASEWLRNALRGAPSELVPLPHPSGASSWVHSGDNPALLERALRTIAARWDQIHPRNRAA